MLCNGKNHFYLKIILLNLCLNESCLNKSIFFFKKKTFYRFFPLFKMKELKAEFLKL